jgi:hypothetical protein
MFYGTRIATRDIHMNLRRKRPKPDEEHEGMPQHRHCPHAKRREDRNPKYHEELQKDVA